MQIKVVEHSGKETAKKGVNYVEVELNGGKYMLSELETSNGNMLKVTKVGETAKADVIALVPTGAVNSIFIK